jgi:hypothetical protein
MNTNEKLLHTLMTPVGANITGGRLESIHLIT